MKPRVVFDTNILISAIIWSGKPSKLLDLVREGKLELIVSEDVLKEFSCILFREKKFGLGKQIILDDVDDILSVSYTVKPFVKINFPRDPADSKILECAVASNADYIVSGDNDLLELKEFLGIKVVSVDELFKTLVP